jgi:hypothetical protein
MVRPAHNQELAAASILFPNMRLRGAATFRLRLAANQDGCVKYFARQLQLASASLIQVYGRLDSPQ